MVKPWRGVALALAIVVAACSSGGSGSKGAVAGPSGGSSPPPTSSRPPAGFASALNVPAEKLQAIRYLAGQTTTVDNGRAAVTELLTRAGIPIVAADDGHLLNDPARPMLISAPVYDFEVQQFADTQHTPTSWPLAALTSALDAAHVTRAGRPVSDADTSALLDHYISQFGSTSPDFAPGFILRSLTLPTSVQDVIAHDRHVAALTPLQLTIAIAAFTSARGTYRTVHKSAYAQVPDCDSGLAESAAAAPGVVSGIADKLGIVIPAFIGKIANVLDYGDAAAQYSAAYRLLSGLKTVVTDDTGGKKHMRHGLSSRPGAGDTFTFTASAVFDSPAAGQTIRCGVFAKMTLPPKGHKLPGVKVKWSLSRAQDLEADVGEGDKTDATPLGGDFTDAAGDSTFRVAPVIEPLCRKSAEDCGKGKETGRINVATAEVDINHVNAAQYNHLSDVDKLLTTLGVIWSLVDAPGTIIAILLKVAKSIGAPRGEGRVTVTRHEKPDYRYSTSSSGITTSLLKCDGIEGPWQLVIDGRSSGFKVKGNVQFTIPQGQLEGPVSGGVSFDYGGGFGKTSLKVTVSGVVKVVNPDSDSPKLDLSGVKQSGSAGVSIGNTTGGFSLSGDSGGAPMTLTSGQFCSKK